MDVYDKTRDDMDETRYTFRDYDPLEVDLLDALCGVSEPWHDLYSEGFPANGR
jgi:hypothetical protein